MAAMDARQLYALVSKYFGDLGPAEVNRMFRIAQLESTSDPAAVGDNFNVPGATRDPNARYDYGLMQINQQHGYDPQRLVSDPEYNMQAARAIYNKQGPTAWTTNARAAQETGAPVGEPIKLPPINPKGFKTANPPPGISIDVDTGQAVYSYGAKQGQPVSDEDYAAAEARDAANHPSVRAAEIARQANKYTTDVAAETADRKEAFDAYDAAQKNLIEKARIAEAASRTHTEANTAGLDRQERARAANLSSATEQYKSSLEAIVKMGELSLAESQQFSKILSGGGDYLARVLGPDSPLATITNADQMNALSTNLNMVRDQVNRSMVRPAIPGTQGQGFQSGYVAPTAVAGGNQPEMPQFGPRKVVAEAAGAPAAQGALGGGFAGTYAAPPAQASSEPVGPAGFQGPNGGNAGVGPQGPQGPEKDMLPWWLQATPALAPAAARFGGYRIGGMPELGPGMGTPGNTSAPRGLLGEGPSGGFDPWGNWEDGVYRELPEQGQIAGPRGAAQIGPRQSAGQLESGAQSQSLNPADLERTPNAWQYDRAGRGIEMPPRGGFNPGGGLNPNGSGLGMEPDFAYGSGGSNARVPDSLAPVPYQPRVPATTAGQEAYGALRGFGRGLRGVGMGALRAFSRVGEMAATQQQLDSLNPDAYKYTQYADGGHTNDPLMLVGEEGPELIHNPEHAPLQVANNKDTRHMMANGVVAPGYATGTDDPNGELGTFPDPVDNSGWTQDSNGGWTPGTPANTFTPEQLAYQGPTAQELWNEASGKGAAIGGQGQGTGGGGGGGGGARPGGFAMTPQFLQQQIIDKARKFAPPSALNALAGKFGPVSAPMGYNAEDNKFNSTTNTLPGMTMRGLKSMNAEDLQALNNITVNEYNTPLANVVDRAGRNYSPQEQLNGQYGRTFQGFTGRGGI